MKYLVIYEKSETGWGAYAPDLPGLGVAAKTQHEAKELIREASNSKGSGSWRPDSRTGELPEYISV